MSHGQSQPSTLLKLVGGASLIFSRLLIGIHSWFQSTWKSELGKSSSRALINVFNGTKLHRGQWFNVIRFHEANGIKQWSFRQCWPPADPHSGFAQLDSRMRHQHVLHGSIPGVLYLYDSPKQHYFYLLQLKSSTQHIKRHDVRHTVTDP